MKEIHLPHLKKLLNYCDKAPNSLDKTKYCIEIYDYVYKILKELRRVSVVLARRQEIS